jgi:hypothetical protein
VRDPIELDWPEFSIGQTRPKVPCLLRLLEGALSDAGVTEASPRLRAGAAHDAAVVAGLIVAELDGCPLETWHPAPALAYLRERSSIRSGLSLHVRVLSCFNRNDYYRIWTHRDASRLCAGAMRIQSALRWRLPSSVRALMLSSCPSRPDPVG